MIRAAGTALLGGALATCAYLFAIPALSLPGVALLLLGLVAGPWARVGARGAQVDCAASPAVLVEGDALELTVTARIGRWPAPGGELVGPGVRRRLRAGARGEVRATATRHPPRRGRHTLGPVRVTLGDPLGLAWRVVEGKAPEVVVLPRPEPIRRPPGGGAGGPTAGGGAGSSLQTDIDGLGPYRPGSPASRIHWPTLARLGDLMERRLVGEGETLPLVVLDAREPAGEQALDSAVRATASLCVALARAGGCRVLLPGDRHPALLGPRLRGWPALHVRLAMVQPAAAEPLVRPSAAAGSVYWVTAGPRLPRWPRAAGGRERWLVTPLDAEAAPPGATEPPAFTVAGCAGRALRIAERAA